MIQHLFFPERIGQYFLFKKKIVGFHVTQKGVSATCLAVKGASIEIEAIYKEPIETPEKTSLAITEILKKVGSYDSLIATINESYVIFKEMTLPLIGEDKIALVLNLEIEAHLPFPVKEAAIDFIVTHTDQKGKSSTIMATAVQKRHVAEMEELFKKAGTKLDALTVGTLSICQFYKNSSLPDLQRIAYILVEQAKIYIAYLHNGNIKNIRVLQDDLEGEDNKKGWESIRFTLNSFSQELPLEKVFFIGHPSEKLLSQAKQELEVPFESMHIENTLAKTPISLASTVTPSQLPLSSFAAAYSPVIMENFNLAKKDATNQGKHFNRQFIPAAILSLAILASLSVHTFVQVRKLSSAAEAVKSRVISDLKKNIPSLKGSSLQDVVKKAHRELQNEETIWFAFSSQTRQSFLKYFFDLSTKIDREVLGLDLKKMVISKNSITLDGSVRNFEAIEEFEKQLKETKLFTSVPELQQTGFNNLVLTLKGDH